MGLGGTAMIFGFGYFVLRAFNFQFTLLKNTSPGFAGGLFFVGIGICSYAFAVLIKEGKKNKRE
jgi:hypothetical protein